MKTESRELRTDWPEGTKFFWCDSDETPFALVPDGAGMVDVLLPDGSPRPGSICADMPGALTAAEFARAADAWASARD